MNDNRMIIFYGLKELLKSVHRINKGSLKPRNIPTKPRSRSVPDVVDTKLAIPYGFAH